MKILQIALVASTGLFLWSPHSMRAATATWTGGGASDNWSEAANWQGGQSPVNGDDVLFGQSGGGDNILNYSLLLTRFAFAPMILPEHNFRLAGGASLTLTGFGIDNNSRIPGFGQPQIPPGVIRQQFYMEAGSTMTFQNTATIGGSAPVFNLPIDLNALGGTTVGGSGGRILFEDNSSASGPPANTFTGLRVYGGTVAGAGGAEMIFRENAKMGFTAAFGIQAGEVAGAQGGTLIFEDNAVASSGSNSILSGTGLGGRLVFRENAQGTASFNIFGAGTLEAGNEAMTQFLDDTVFDGFAQTFAGQASGMQGGRLELRQRAVFGGVNGGFIINRGSYLGGEGGRTVFYDDTRIVGLNAIISNQSETEGPNPGSVGGVTEFLGNSRAGSARIDNGGASSAAPGTVGARTLFRESSSAENATISAGGGSVEVGAAGSNIEFSGASTAANATITALSGEEVFPGPGFGLGGRILFLEMASGGAASVTVELGGVFEMSGLTTAGTTLGSIAGAGEFFLGSKALTVGSNNASTVVAGVIADGGQAGGTGASLTKVGTGTLELGGVNTYTGATNVSAGALLVTGALANGAVAVAGGATLGGTGTIGGAVTVADGGIVAPGKMGAGTLTTGALTLSPASILNYQIGSLSDRIDVNGALTLDGTVNLAALPGLTVGVYRLLNYAGAFTDNVLALGTVPAGINPSDFSIETSVAGQVNLVLNGSAGELLFWDGANTSANGVVNGGTASWTSAATNWTNSGGTLNQAWASQRAVFSGAAGVVTLGENVSTTGLQFVTNGYALNGPAGTALTLVGTAPIRVDAGVSANINATITGGGALDKTGIGTLTLSAENNYTGGTTVTDGALNVTNAAGLGLGSGPVTVLPTLDAYLRFIGNASAGAVAITNRGATPADTGTGYVEFLNTSNAGTATISNLGNAGAEGVGAFLQFENTARAGSAVIENFGAAFANPVTPGFEPLGAGRTFFRSSSNADSATITNHPGAGNGLFGGRTEFLATSNAGTANIINRGGTSPGAIGGATRFSGTGVPFAATAGTATLTVEGGSNGGLGGTIHFTGNAAGGLPRVVFLPGAGTTPNGLLDISATNFAAIVIGSIEGNGRIALGGKRIEVGGRNVDTEFSGAIDGAGGSLRKVGTAMLTLAGDSTYSGGTTVADGVLRVTNPSGLSLGTGSVFVQLSTTSELRFSLTGSAGGLAITNVGGASNVFGLTTFRSSATGATATITNSAATANGQIGGQTRFYATSTAANSTINNFGTSFTGGGSFGAEVTFFEDSTAGAATIVNGGGLAANAEGGQANFFGNSSAGTASITNFLANIAGAFPGATVFRNNATAGGATIRNVFSAVVGAGGGVTEFYESATGGTARITLEGGFGNGALASTARFFNNSSADRAEITVSGSQFGTGAAGLLEFSNSATAGAATVRNTRASAVGGGGGQTQFRGASSAGTGAFTNEGGQSSAGGSGFTEFHDTANAGSAAFFNEASLAGGGFGARTRFFDAASAGTATFDNEGAKVNRATTGDTVEASETNFRNTSSAGAATLINRGMTAALGESGGITQFFNATKAGTAMITNEGSAFSPTPDPSGGWTKFLESASAEQATITNRSRLSAAGGGGTTLFEGLSATVFSTAAQATITNEGGLFAFQAGGQTIFSGIATAGAATFINQGGLAANAFGGATFFRDTTMAGTASFTNEGGAANGADGGSVNFLGDSRAQQSTILSEGGQMAGASGGSASFFNRSNAESATLRGRAGVASALGGRIGFYELSDGGTARVILEGSGAGAAELSLFITDASLGIGSLEGSGNVILGGKNLAIGSNNLDTLFSGVIRDGAGTPGSLNKVGTGTLDLSGANTYTGLTQVSAGILRISGSIAGAVQVNSGGTLGGNGTTGGGVIVGPGGVVSPGASIGAFETTDLLSLEGDAVFELEIDSVAGTADRITADGISLASNAQLLAFELAPAALEMGFQFNVIDNTSTNPIAGIFSGFAQNGEFDLGANRFRISYTGGDGNDLTLTNVIPEPSCTSLVALGVLLLGVRTGKRRTLPEG